MQRGPKRLIIAALAITIGLTLALVASILIWGSVSDRTNATVVSSGQTRRYLLHVPNTYDRSKATPLMISFHPAATWPAFEMNISHWNDLADQQGFIVAYPAGTGAFFGGLGRGQLIWPAGPQTLPRDVRFISDLMDTIEAHYNIDPDRIYADGISNGGGMAFLLSCKLSERIAAVGVVAGAHEEPWNCGESKAVPVVAFHGTADTFAPYLGGRSPIAPGLMANIPDWTAHVARRNQCQGDPVDTRMSTSVRRRVYTDCARNADVVLYTIDGGGHSWPGGSGLPEWIVGRTTREVNATTVMWNFFVAHPRRH